MAANDTVKPASTSAEPEAASPRKDTTTPTDTTVEMATDAPDKQDTMGTNGERAEADGTANGSAKKKDTKRRSSGVPEHKSKKANKKKSTPNLHLDVQPGELHYARMKGHPPWPAIIADESMLPETLLAKRPVSAANPDGTFRADFRDDGKNVKDRRYPIMFLGTNEFAWQPNTELQPLDLDELKEMVEKNDQGKKSKLLWRAYQTAAEDHDLDYFKMMLSDHEDKIREWEREAEEKAAAVEEKKAAAEAKKEKTKEKAAKRKSKGSADTEGDVEMEDAAAEEEATEPKPSKKRKKDADSGGEPEKPAKTPKTKLKVKGPKEIPEEAEKKSKKAAPKRAKPAAAAKPPKPSSEEDVADVVPPEPEQTPEEKQAQKEKAVLFLRHKLQKGFISRDQPPVEEDMQSMSENLTTLETHADLDAQVIKATKINKVLKAILKIDFIPREAEFSFKERCTKLLNDYNKLLGAGDSLATPTTAEPSVNGVKHNVDDKRDGGEKNAADEADASTTPAKTDAPAEKPEETTAVA